MRSLIIWLCVVVVLTLRSVSGDEKMTTMTTSQWWAKNIGALEKFAVR